MRLSRASSILVIVALCVVRAQSFAAAPRSIVGKRNEPCVVLGQSSALAVTSSPEIDQASLAKSPSRPRKTPSSRRRMQRPHEQHSRVDTDTTKTVVGLTRAQEIQFSFQIRTFRAAVRLRDQLARDHKQVTEQEWAAACGTTVLDLRRVCAEGQEARQALVEANVGLVTAIAKRHYTSLKYATADGVGTILTLQDFIQEGNLGLMEAAERYEPEHGFRFSTYATYWVKQRILRSISDSSRTIRLPQHVHSMLTKISKTKHALQQEIGREPSLPELAHELEISVDKLRQYTDIRKNVVSLEVPLRSGGSFKNDDSRTLGDTLASDAPTPEEEAHAQHLRRDILETMDYCGLGALERRVIRQRFGLEHGKPASVSETAQRLQLSRDRVRLVQARALNKLRHPQRNYRLKEYLMEEVPSSLSTEHETTSSSSNDRLWF